MVAKRAGIFPVMEAKEVLATGKEYKTIDDLAPEVELSSKGLRAYTDQYLHILPLPVVEMKVTERQSFFIIFLDQWADWKQEYLTRIRHNNRGRGRRKPKSQQQPVEASELAEIAF